LRPMAPSSFETESEPIRLHFFPGTRAVRVRWMLEEIGVSYQLSIVDLRRGAHKSENYLTRYRPSKSIMQRSSNPLGICLYLADRFWEADLAPLPEERKRRADYCAWMAFSTGTLEPAIIEQVRARKARARRIAPIEMGPALTPFDDVASYMERHLAGRPCLLSDQMTAADIMNGSLMAWAQEIGLLEGREAIRAWVADLKARPAYSRAIGESGRGM
jgi:glutathione S-transferase